MSAHYVSLLQLSVNLGSWAYLQLDMYVKANCPINARVDLCEIFTLIHFLRETLIHLHE
jgi:hypothetical protein